MKVGFYASIGKRYDMGLFEHFGPGVTACGDEIRLLDIHKDATVIDDLDVIIVVGVKDKSLPTWQANQAAGKRCVILDKGYTRLRGGVLNTRFWRVSLDAFQPTERLCTGPQRSPDRWLKTGVPVVPWQRDDGDTVVFCGSSQKYNNWHELGESTAYATKIMNKLKEITKGQFTLVYRPKPSSKEAKDCIDIPGFRFSPPKDSLPNYTDTTAHCIVTFGSNAAVESICHGVPAVVIGDGVARPISSQRLQDVLNPFKADHDSVLQWLANLAYWQWEPAEMLAGKCWRFLRGEIERE